MYICIYTYVYIYICIYIYSALEVGKTQNLAHPRPNTTSESGSPLRKKKKTEVQTVSSNMASWDIPYQNTGLKLDMFHCYGFSTGWCTLVEFLQWNSSKKTSLWHVHCHRLRTWEQHRERKRTSPFKAYPWERWRPLMTETSCDLLFFPPGMVLRNQE